MNTRIFSTAVWSLTAGLIFAGLFGLGCTEDKQKQPDWEIQRHIQRGNQALSEGRLQVAEGEFRKVIGLEPQHAIAHHKLARVLVQLAEHNPQGRAELYSQAIGALEKSLELDPKGRQAWKDLARTCQLAGRTADAVQAYGKLLKLDPEDVGSQAELAILLSKAGQPGQAEAAFKSGLARHPDSGKLRLAYGRFLLEKKDMQAAEKQFLAIKPNCAEYYEALDELGSLAARRGDFGKVRSIYQKLVDMNPNDFMAWELLAAVDEREKKFKAAEEKYRRSLEIDRLHMSAWLGLGRVLSAQDRREEAVYAFKKADGFIGSKPDQALELADELVALQETAWALSVLERARIAAKDQGLLTSIEEKIKKLSGR